MVRVVLKLWKANCKGNNLFSTIAEVGGYVEDGREIFDEYEEGERERFGK